MRRHKILALSAMLVLLVVGACACHKKALTTDEPNKEEQKPDSSKNNSGLDPLTGLDYSNLIARNHPRVIFTDKEFSAIRAAIKKNPALKEMHDSIISFADRTIGAADLVRKLSGKRLLSVSRNAEKRILYCAYAYKTTGEEKYLNQAEHDIVTVCNFTDWNAAKHFLDVGEMAAGVGLGYDWLYNELYPSTKELVLDALCNFAFSPALNDNPNFYRSVNNWNQVCNGGLVCAALAIYEKKPDVAKEIINKAVETNAAVMKSMYSPDGNYPEGYEYWNYGTAYEALMLTAMETAAGSDAGISASEGFAKSGKYMVFMEGPTKECFNYSDAASTTHPCLAQWYFASKFGDTSVLFWEKDRLSAYSDKSNDESRLLPFIAHFAYKIGVTSLDDIVAPKDFIFRGEGTTPVVLIHGNWANDNSDKFLGIKGGKAQSSHSHMDAGTFVYDAFGERWAADLGLQSYGTLEPYINLWDMKDGSERWTAFRYNNFNHNTLTINDTYHKVSGEAKFTEVIDDGTRKGAVIDISAPLGNEVSSAVRTVYLEGDNLVVQDEIVAQGGKDANVRWTMVTPAVPTLEDENICLKSASGKYMYLTASSSTGHALDYRTWSTVSTNSWDASNTGYYECGYEVVVKAGEKAIVTVKLSPDK